MFIDDDPIFKFALLFVALVALIWALSQLCGGTKNDNE